jgi:hypothetical protein
LLGCVPDFIQIDTKILVNEKMSHGNDIFPGNYLVLFLEFGGGPICSFPDNLDMIEYPYLEKL